MRRGTGAADELQVLVHREVAPHTGGGRHEADPRQVWRIDVPRQGDDAPRQGPEQRRLAGAVTAHHGRHLPARRRQTDAVESDDDAGPRGEAHGAAAQTPRARRSLIARAPVPAHASALSAASRPCARLSRAWSPCAPSLEPPARARTGVIERLKRETAALKVTIAMTVSTRNDGHSA